jgi:hypothetical protein
MGAARNLSFPSKLKSLKTEWAAARPFVIALGAGAEYEISPANQLAAITKRNQKSASSICADQEFFHAVNPRASDTPSSVARSL